MLGSFSVLVKNRHGTVGAGIMEQTHIMVCCAQDIADGLVTPGYDVMVVKL
jgi:hypothetical protein